MEEEKQKNRDTMNIDTNWFMPNKKIATIVNAKNMANKIIENFIHRIESGGRPTNSKNPNRLI